jgi:hypothetical protein
MSGTLLPALLVHEHRVWAALVAGDAQADMALLSADFLGVYPDGFAGRAAHGAQLAAGPSIVSYEIFEPRVVSAGEGHALLAYRARYLRAGAAATEEMYVSSLWRRDAAGWINIFSQDTPATGIAVP